jgi:excisionase family DNA binding protein
LRTVQNVRLPFGMRFDSDRTVVPLPDHERFLGGSVVDRLWTIHDVSAYLAVPVGTLYQWRHRGEGPPAIRLGRHLRYDPDSVHHWALNKAS